MSERREKGRATIDAMLASHEVEQVQPSRAHADKLLDQAAKHVSSARATHEGDPVGAYATLYDAARKALWAVLAVQGLRPTRDGGHRAVYEAVIAQFEPPLGHLIRPFDRMRRTRNSHEYPDVDTPTLEPADVLDDIPKVQRIVDFAIQAVEHTSPY